MLLPDDAVAEWQRVVPELQRLGLTKSIDAASLTAYCLAYARMCAARRVINVEGIFAENSQGRVRSPAVVIEESASKELRAWAHEFGLTPSAESALTGPEGAGDDEGNPFAGTG